ncbi:hypothetical protein H4R24_000339 [Coemansia sp. RSA 988]|nr:hypothetical protein H4R24_000339 [Coemansia sp. RSA 988]
MIAKEREREGDEFADKESFVTIGYKEQKEQRQKLVEEEDAKEKEMSTGRKSQLAFDMMGPAAFSRQFLDHIEQEDAKKAAIIADADFTKHNKGQNTSATGSNNDGSKDIPLSAGLNIVGRVGSQSKPTSNRQPSTTKRKEEEQLRKSVDKQATTRFQPRNYSSKPNWADVESHEREKLAAQDRERQLLVARYSRRNDNVAIEAARQRYLERKQVRLEST